MAIDIPIIDISSPSQKVAKQLLDAACAHGFVYISNADDAVQIPPEDVQSMFDLSKTFFKSPDSVKAECPYQTGKNQGWVGMQRETLDPKTQKRGDFKELVALSEPPSAILKVHRAFNIGEYANGKASQPLPAPLRPQEAQLGRFFDQCHTLCNKILQLLGAALEIPQDEGGDGWFAERHDRSKGPSGSILRLLYYPALPPIETTDIRAGAHSDYGSITLLFQQPNGQPGLEILPRTGIWTPVPVDPANSNAPPILVNIGDLLSYWTDGLLTSTVHRVVFPPEVGGGKDRYSMAFFCHPVDDAKLVPIPSPIIKKKAKGGEDGASERGHVLTAKDHLLERLAATYGAN